LFNFEEIVDVLFGGRPGVPRNSIFSPKSFRWRKGIYTSTRTRSDWIEALDPKAGYYLDTRCPRLVDLISLIDERMGKLENRSSRIIITS